MSRWRQDPLAVCESKHTNTTLEFHECVCQFDYRRQKKYQQALKYKHCLLADEMRRIDNFELYVIIAVVVGVVLIFSVAAFCSCKWYFHTNDNPCGCCPCHCCKKKKRKKKDETAEVEGDAMSTHAFENGNQAWTPIRLVPTKEMARISQEPHHEELVEHKRKGLCMKFCLSDPVQDCCEFFDCDIMWRKKSIYTIPVFGRRKPPPMQRRPTRPAPPPPKPPVPPIVKHPEPLHIGFEELECEPIPEAPPSPEPVRVDQPRAMYVDPFAFLQKPFLKNKEKTCEEEPEALYSKMKGFVFGKNKKSNSMASLNQVAVSKNPDTVSNTSSKKSKHSKTGSLASLHNLSDEQLDKSYQAKRSMSLASLRMVEENKQQLVPKGPESRLQVARSRGSLHNICEDDIPMSLKTDEYIDLEEMNKRIEAKMMAAHTNSLKHKTTMPHAPPPASSERKPTAPPVAEGPSMQTPDFIPASAYAQHPQPTTSQHCPPYNPQYVPGIVWEAGYRPVSPQGSHDSSFTMLNGEGMLPKYYPPMPATPEKPAVPARLAVGTPIVSTGTLGRHKPTVPPRPGSNSPKPRAPQPPSAQGTLGRSGPLVKPTSPPPPPPVTAPIESSL